MSIAGPIDTAPIVFTSAQRETLSKHLSETQIAALAIACTHARILHSAGDDGSRIGAARRELREISEGALRLADLLEASDHRLSASLVDVERLASGQRLSDRFLWPDQLRAIAEHSEAALLKLPERDAKPTLRMQVEVIAPLIICAGITVSRVGGSKFRACADIAFAAMGLGKSAEAAIREYQKSRADTT